MEILILFGVIFIFLLAFSSNGNSKASPAQSAAQLTIFIIFGIPLGLLVIIYLFYSPWFWLVVSVLGFLSICLYLSGKPIQQQILDNNKTIADKVSHVTDKVANIEHFLANTKTEMKASYKPLTNFAMLDDITDLFLLNNTEKYLREIIVAQKKHEDSYSNFIETEMSNPSPNPYQGQLFRNAASSSHSTLITFENQLHLVQCRIKKLT